MTKIVLKRDPIKTTLNMLLNALASPDPITLTLVPPVAAVLLGRASVHASRSQLTPAVAVAVADAASARPRLVAIAASGWPPLPRPALALAVTVVAVAHRELSASLPRALHAAVLGAVLPTSAASTTVTLHAPLLAPLARIALLLALAAAVSRLTAPLRLPAAAAADDAPRVALTIPLHSDQLPALRRAHKLVAAAHTVASASDRPVRASAVAATRDPPEHTTVTLAPPVHGPLALPVLLTLALSISSALCAVALAGCIVAPTDTAADLLALLLRLAVTLLADTHAELSAALPCDRTPTLSPTPSAPDDPDTTTLTDTHPDDGWLPCDTSIVTADADAS